MKALKRAFFVGFFIARRQLKRTNRFMTWLTVSIMMLTFFNLVATSGFLVGIVVGSEKSFKSQWTGDLFVSNLDNEDYIERSDEILRSIGTIDEVKSVSPRIVRGASFEANWWKKKGAEDENKVGSSLAGIDPYAENETTGLAKYIVEGEWLKENDPQGIVLGSGLLQRYSPVADLVSLLKDVEVGSFIRVTVGTTTQEFIVRGIIDSKVDFVSNRAYILDGEARKMLNKKDTDMTEIAIVMNEGKDPYLVKTPLMNNGYGEYARVNTASEGAPAFLVNIKLFFSVIGTILGSVSVVVALITIFIIIYINALTRRRQIGILKAIGISPLALEISYILQALFYVIIGSVIALFVIFFLLKPYLDVNPIVTPFADIVLVAEPFTVFKKWALVMLVSMLAGYLPARLIIKQNTLNAILGRQ